MKIQTLGWLVGVTALISSASVLACSQAEVVCQAGHAGSGLAFAAKYYPVGAAVAACGIPGDQVGLETYHPKGGGDDGTQPDFSVPSLVAIQTDSMGNLIGDKANLPNPSVDPDGLNTENMDGTHVLAKHAPYALGSFATVSPDADGFCVMAAPKPAEQNFPHVDAIPPDMTTDPPDPGAPEVPAEAVKYEWTNVKVYVTASAQGTQFSGHLKYTDDACSAEYNVAGVWPSAFCGKEVPDGMDMNGKPKTKTVPDQSACCPNPDPVGGRAAGSGINPDFPVKCDPDLFLCVLDTPDPSKLPVLNPTWALDADGVATGICKLTTAAAAP